MGQSFRAGYILAIPGILDGDKITGTGRGGTIDPNAMRDVEIVPWVSDAQLIPMPAATVTLTQDTYVVEGHPDGVRAWDVVLTGSVENPELKSHVRKSDGTESESHKRMRAVSELLVNALKTARRTVYFYAVDEGWHLECVPQGLQFRRGNPNKTGMQYTIKLRAVRRIEAPKLVNVIPEKAKPGDDQSFWDDIAEIYSDAKDIANKAKIGLYAVIGGIHITLGLADKILTELEALVEEIDNMLGAVRYLLATPHALAVRARKLANKARSVLDEALRDTWASSAAVGSSTSYGAVGASADIYADLSRSLLGSLWAIENSMNIMAMRALASAGVASEVDRLLEIKATDSMASIAAVVYGDPSRAGELARENGLRYPYISATPGDGIVSVGDTIRVPGGDGTIIGSLANEGDTPDEVLFGIDFRLDDNQDLYRVGADDDMDIALVGGVPNMLQAIDTKNKTIRGTNRHFPDLGLPVDIGAGATDTAFATFVASVTESFKADDRIVAVQSLKLKDDGNGWEWEGLLTLASGLQLTVTGAT